MNKSLRFVAIFAMLILLAACQQSETSDNKSVQDDNPNSSSPTLSTHCAMNWDLTFNPEFWRVETSTDNSAVFVLLPDVYSSDNDKSIYLAISHRPNISAKESANRELQETNDLAEISTHQIATINSYAAQHIHTEWGSTPDATFYDIYYIDVPSGCYAITLCYFKNTSEIWISNLSSMTDSFSLKTETNE